MSPCDNLFERLAKNWRLDGKKNTARRNWATFLLDAANQNNPKRRKSAFWKLFIPGSPNTPLPASGTTKLQTLRQLSLSFTLASISSLGTRPDSCFDAESNYCGGFWREDEFSSSSPSSCSLNFLLDSKLSLCFLFRSFFSLFEGTRVENFNFHATAHANSRFFFTFSTPKTFPTFLISPKWASDRWTWVRSRAKALRRNDTGWMLAGEVFWRGNFHPVLGRENFSWETRYSVSDKNLISQ